jgi:DNA modification methylase
VTVRILQGDCRVRMAELEAGSVHTCVTSPPYWGLRDYGTEPLSWPAVSYSPLAGLPQLVDIPSLECSLGLEPTLEAFVGHMVLVFREVRRVLRDDGTCWVNMGDSYAGSWGAQGRDNGEVGRRENAPAVSALSANQVGAAPQSTRTGSLTKYPGLKAKDLVAQPWRLALALQADGWWLRQDVVWAKKNPMPESIKDRCTKAHEYVFLLSKSARYYFDHEAIKEDASPDTHPRRAKWKTPDGWDTSTGEGGHGGFHKNGREKGKYGALTGQDDDGEHRTKAGLNRKLAAAGSGTKNNDSFDEAMAVMPERAAKRSVWSIATEAFSEAHFATFPTKLIEPCILAGTSEKGCCPHCRAPWVRQTGRPCEKCEAFIPTQGKSCGACGHVRDWKAERGISEELNATEWDKPGRSVPRKLGESGKQGSVPPQASMALDWAQSCSCPAHKPVPCTVLDPFGGSGTTGLVADRLQRNAILCELNPEYAAMAERRVTGDAPLFAEVAL